MKQLSASLAIFQSGILYEHASSQLYAAHAEGDEVWYLAKCSISHCWMVNDSQAVPAKPDPALSEGSFNLWIEDSPLSILLLSFLYSLEQNFCT